MIIWEYRRFFQSKININLCVHRLYGIILLGNKAKLKQKYLLFLKTDKYYKLNYS